MRKEVLPPHDAKIGQMFRDPHDESLLHVVVEEAKIEVRYERMRSEPRIPAVKELNVCWETMLCSQTNSLDTLARGPATYSVRYDDVDQLLDNLRR